jgi:hypothetical protein
MTLRVAPGVLGTSFELLRRCGARVRECVVVWTGAQAEPDYVDGVVQPKHTATACLYDIDDIWIGEFWQQLAAEGRTVRAQVHTHPGDAYHSPRDDVLSLVHLPGYLSLVIPRFARGPIGLEDSYLAVRREQGGWSQLDPATALRFER